MPAIVVVLLLLGVTYQLFFRYDHWTGGVNQSISYERDNLTGETHVVRPGEKISFVSRLFGRYEARKPIEDTAIATEDASAATFLMNADSETVAGKTAQKDVKAAVAKQALKEAINQPRVMAPAEDLNADGSKEEVIKTKSAPDGLLDISVVSGSKELFYGRGKELVVLPSKHNGWQDLALKTDAPQPFLFRYNKALDGYEAIDAQ